MLLITPYLKRDVSFRLENNISFSFRFQHYGSTLRGVWQEVHAAEHLFQTIYMYVHGGHESRLEYLDKQSSVMSGPRKIRSRGSWSHIVSKATDA